MRMQNDLWQTETLEQLKNLLQSLDTVQAAIVVGSFANAAIQPDFWSDIDLVVVVSDEAINQFYPGTEWLRPIGPVYAASRSQGAYHNTLRVCFVDMHRLDLIFLPASAFEAPSAWGYNPFQTGYRVLFSRSIIVDEFLSQEHAATSDQLDPETQFWIMSNDFWFKGMLAVYKVVRNDLLIALHLTLDLARDCLVLGMMLRDRAEGTQYHRIGGVGNELIDRINLELAEYSSASILDMIEKYSQIYDDLAGEWRSDYRANRSPLLDWIKQARETLSRSDRQIRS